MLISKKQYDFEDLVVLVEVLRSEDGCPWDREQDHHSIRKDLIEETYEVIEAIDTDDPVLLREELGDLLLQVIFHAEIETEQNSFDIHDVANDVCTKLIHRHPHVFGEVQADTSAQVLANWEVIKSAEKERITVTDKLRAIPPMFPALMRAQKVGKKASCFDFSDAEEVLKKIEEELSELRKAMNADDRENMQEELGDLLLSVTSLARHLHIDSEEALVRATDKFIDRFDEIEQAVLAQGKVISEISTEELNRIWDQNKHKKTQKK
ncbi:MAG: nucleoside triphosphate pyrophosphohydrolase [Clostridia bacterium]|nr:nucleoside triphosphate pyrophosphohydrolase [Clostridia bacterium]